MAPAESDKAKEAEDSRDWQSLAKLFREHREKFGLSVSEVASGIELDGADLVRLESGEISIPVDVVCALSNFLNVDSILVTNLVGEIRIEEDEKYEDGWRNMDSR